MSDEDAPEYRNREGGILTPGQREYLVNHDERPSTSNDRVTRHRIRKRFTEAIRDFRYFPLLPQEDVTNVFEEFIQGSEDLPEDHVIPCIGMFNTLYTGLGKSRFEEFMNWGIRQSIVTREVRERDVFPITDFDFDVVIDPDRSFSIPWIVGELKSHEQSGDVPEEFSHKHYQALKASEKLDEFSNQYVKKLEDKVVTTEEKRDKEKLKGFIPNSSPSELCIYENFSDDEDVTELIEQRREEIANRLLEDPSVWGITRGEITVLENVGFFDDETAEKYRQRYKYIEHLYECSGALEDDGVGYGSIARVTPDMFDQEMETAHKKRAEEIKVKYQKSKTRRNVSISVEECRCLLVEATSGSLEIETKEIRQKYRELLEQDDNYDDRLPREYANSEWRQ